MDIEEIKEIRLADYLYSMGISPAKQQGCNLWYKSPFQEKEILSLKVDTDRNRWCDFGTCKEGKIISLAAEFCHTNHVPDLIRHIEDKILSIRPDILPFESQNAQKSAQRYVQQNPQLNIAHLEAVSLSRPSLLRYLQQRGINTELAKRECKELHFFINGNPNFAIGFPNISGGYVIRNSHLDGCTTKDISYIQQDKPQGKCLLFEGFIEYLSFLTIRKENSPQYPEIDKQDYIILNSLNNLSQATPYLAKYNSIHCFFDNDYSGYDASEQLRTEIGYRVDDIPNNYNGHKNLNDYLCSRLSEQCHSYTTDQQGEQTERKSEGFRR